MIQPGFASAAVNTVTPTPARVNIPAKGAATVNIRWAVNRTSPTGTADPVTSANASLVIGGVPVAVLGNALNQISTLAGGQTGTLFFNETLVLSPELARRIANAAPGTVTIDRSFTDTFTTQIGRVQVAAGGVSAGELILRRIELSFENNQAHTDVVPQGSTLRAVADISFRGGGLLNAEWRIVDPAASLGSPHARVLTVIRQQLVSSGEGTTRLVSPQLPTTEYGLYMVSLHVEDTDRGITAPVLRYFVIGQSGDVPPLSLSVKTPLDGAALGNDTVFSWESLQNAQAYQVEIFSEDGLTPLAGKIVPATDLSLKLSALSFEKLETGKAYRWHIRAFSGGKLIGQSPRYNLHIP